MAVVHGLVVRKRDNGADLPVGGRQVGRPGATVLALAAVLSLAACGAAGDSVSSADRARVSTRATATTRSSAVLTPSSGASTTSLVGGSASPTATSGRVIAPPTSGGDGEVNVTTVVPRALETLPTATTPASTGTTTTPAEGGTAGTTGPVAPAGTVLVTSVACGRHEDGDWVVFRLDNSGATATAGYGPAPVAVSGDRAIVVTFSPAANATSGPPANGGCGFATEVVPTASAEGTVSWVIGVRGEPRISTVGPGPSGAAFAYVVKLLA